MFACIIATFISVWERFVLYASKNVIRKDIIKVVVVILWFMTPCTLVAGYRRFRQHIVDNRNVCNPLKDYMASQHEPNFCCSQNINLIIKILTAARCTKGIC